MPMTEVIRDNFPRLMWMAGSFLAGFAGAVLVFKSKLAILTENQKNMAVALSELKLFNSDIEKEKKMIGAKVDEGKHETATLFLSLTNCQNGAREWRCYHNKKEESIFKALETIQGDIKELIREVGKK